MASRTVVRMLVVAGTLALLVVSCSGRTPPPPTPPSEAQQVAARLDDAKHCPVTVANGKAPPGERPSSLDHGNGAQP